MKMLSLLVGMQAFIHLPILLHTGRSGVGPLKSQFKQEFAIQLQGVQLAGHLLLLLPSGFISAFKPWLCSLQPITKHGGRTRAWPILPHSGLL